MDIYNLLNINADKLRDFYLLGNNVIGIHEDRVLKSNLTKLKRIEDNMPVDNEMKVEPKSVDEIIRKVIRLSKNHDYSPDNWSFFELRVVSYYLKNLCSHHNGYLFAIDLLDNNWKDLFFSGIVIFLMNSWHSIEPELKEKTSRLLVSRLQKYSGRNKRYNIFKANANLLEMAGPIRMSALISQKGLNLNDAPRILGFKSSNLKQQYYSDVIIRYVKNNRIKDLDFIEEIFKLNDLDRTKKLVLAHLVGMENDSPDALFRTKLCRFANGILGDITLSATWAPFVGATQEDVDILLRAKRLINIWFTQKSIETFFEICVQDADRKNFWLRYVDKINAFKIVGSLLVKRNLMSSNKLGGMLMKQFIETNSQVSQTSALVLFINDKMMIEFSDVGALYVYELTHSMVGFVKKGNVNSTNDLKEMSIGQLMDHDFYYPYGRMTHRGQWQERLSMWLADQVLNKNVKKFSFTDDNETDIFKPIPLTSENHTDSFEKEYKTTENNAGKNTNSQCLSSDNDTQENDVSNVNLKFTGKKLSGIRYSMSSKIIDDNIVVANDEAYYICNLRKHLFVLLKPMDKGEKALGNIWLKRTDQYDWKEIIHFNMGNEKTIGFIKINDFKFKFKESLYSDNQYKTSF